MWGLETSKRIQKESLIDTEDSHCQLQTITDKELSHRLILVHCWYMNAQYEPSSYVNRSMNLYDIIRTQDHTTLDIEWSCYPVALSKACNLPEMTAHSMHKQQRGQCACPPLCVQRGVILTTQHQLVWDGWTSLYTSQMYVSAWTMM